MAGGVPLHLHPLFTSIGTSSDTLSLPMHVCTERLWKRVASIQKRHSPMKISFDTALLGTAALRKGLARNADGIIRIC